MQKTIESAPQWLHPIIKQAFETAEQSDQFLPILFVKTPERLHVLGLALTGSSKEEEIAAMAYSKQYLKENNAEEYLLARCAQIYMTEDPEEVRAIQRGEVPDKSQTAVALLLVHGTKEKTKVAVCRIHLPQGKRQVDPGAFEDVDSISGWGMLFSE